MNDVSWDNNQGMINGQDMAGIHRPNNNNNISAHSGNRSQDDATVGYFFQRPQTELELNSYANKRWAVGDDSVIEQVYFALSHVIN